MLEHCIRFVSIICDNSPKMAVFFDLSLMEKQQLHVLIFMTWLPLLPNSVFVY